MFFYVCDSEKDEYEAGKEKEIQKEHTQPQNAAKCWRRLIWWNGPWWASQISINNHSRSSPNKHFNVGSCKMSNCICIVINMTVNMRTVHSISINSSMVVNNMGMIIININISLSPTGDVGD